jgi:hypothetical protein
MLSTFSRLGIESNLRRDSLIAKSSSVEIVEGKHDNSDKDRARKKYGSNTINVSVGAAR